MVSDDDDLDCPLCMEEFDIADRNFRPCPCGYQICRFCWHHIKSNLNGRCPACRRQYSDQIVQFIPVSADEIVRLKKEKKEKERQHKDMKDSSRRHLSNVRVVQKNLVYVLGLSSKYASVENEFFKKYGKIAKLVVSKRSTQQTGGQSSSSVGIYVTYCRKEDAAKAISGINGSTCEGRSLRASYGTTKYCTYYLRHMSCPNPNCMYLHEPGEDVDSYTKDSLSIGKHPSGSGNQTYPNKRMTPTCSTSTTTASGAAGSSTTAAAAAAGAATTSSQVPPKPLVRSSTSNDAQPEPPRKSAWAPIPKVIPPPPPPPVAPEPPVETPEPEPKAAEPVSASASSSTSSVPVSAPAPTAATPLQPAQPKPSSSGSEQTKNKIAPEKASKPIPIEKKPALPAAASWGKGTNNLASSHESVSTPTNFGPSLSDALNAPQKPKHSPSIPRKKEKKLKSSKMIRLEDFEEGVRPSGKSGKKQQKEAMVRTESALSAQIHRQQQQQESPWKPIQVPSQSAKPSSEPPAPAPATAAATTTATPSPAKAEAESSRKGVSVPSKEIDAMDTDESHHHHTEADESAEQKPRADAESLLAEPLREDSHHEESIVAESKPEEPPAAAAAAQLKKEETAIEEKENIQMAPSSSHVNDNDQDERRDSSGDEAAIPVEDKTAAFDQYKSSPDTVDQPSFANYILGSVMLDNDDRNSEDAFDMEGGLSSLKGDLDSEYDAMRDAHDEHHQRNVLDELERSEKVQEDDHGFTSPLLAMERFSALINQELVSGSPERPMEEFDRRPAQHPPSSLFQDLGLPFEGNRAHGPPPGIHGPPEWRSHNFDPFNGQDPAAARRLQHSQQMLEASGLFPGFPPRPPPMFGVSPDFHASGTPPPPPPPPQGPPSGMFGLPPAPMMHHRPEFMNMPPGLNPPMVDKSGMASIEQGMRDMHMQQQQQQQLQQNSNVHNESLRTMQDDLRALLPNVNISFGPMRDDNMAQSNKPHTPGHDESELLLHRRPSESQHLPPRFEFNNQPNNEQPRELDRFSVSPRAEEKIFFASNGTTTYKPDDAYPEHEHERTQEEGEGGENVRQEAQNFFGEFLRKAAATAPGGAPIHMPMEEAPRKASLPFQDPAIMSVRMSGEKKAPQDMTESQNTLLQLLGGQQPPPQPQQHREPPPPPMLLNQAMRSPPEDLFGREMAPKPFDMFMEHQQQHQQQHSPQQHQQQQQHQPPSHQPPPPPPMPFHHHQPPPPPHPPFMSGYMGGMPPPPPHYQHHHMQDPPPGMMPMPPPQPPPPHPPLPIPMQLEMGFRPRNGNGPANFPPGLFPGSAGGVGSGVRHDGM